MIYFSEVTNERYYIDTFGLKKWKIEGYPYNGFEKIVDEKDKNEFIEINKFKKSIKTS